MKATAWIIIVVLAVLVIGGVYLATQGYKPSSTPTPTPNPTPSPPTPGTPTSHNVNIQNFAFSPSTLTISAGDTVIWTNGDSTSHTVTSDSGSELGSSSLANGASYSHTFNAAGTYSYHCSIHTSMKGTVVVQ